MGATQAQLQPGNAHVSSGSADYGSALVSWESADTSYASGNFCVITGDAFWLTDAFAQAAVMYDASLPEFADASADFYLADCAFFEADGHWDDATAEFNNLFMQL